MKRGISLLLISLLLVSFFAMPVMAAENDSDNGDDDTIIIDSDLEGVDKAYECLENKLGSDCDNAATTEQAALSLLAIAYDTSLQSDCKSSLNSFKDGNCFSANANSNCDIKSTAQAILALENINSDVDDYVDWILDQRKLTTNLDWFLEIDANEETTCDVNGQDFTINENKKISGSSGCLDPAESNYYLKIENTESCLNNNYTTSCDKGFITTLLYKIDSTFYVSSLTNEASASGETNEKVNSYCFGLGGCNFEASLWAALALAKTGEDISAYIPYLTSEYDEAENRKYFPSAFLYMLTNEDDYYIEVTEKQKQGKYWEENTNKYYDTALALLSLQDLFLEEVDNAKDELLSTQSNEGCWGNTQDTSFLLYAGWPKSPKTGGGDDRASCTSFGKYCVSSGECSSVNILDNYYCSGIDVCCETQPVEETCSQKGGVICPVDQECTIADVYASDTSYCCQGSCILSLTENECKGYNPDYMCKVSCSDDEDEKFYNCDFTGDVCCAPKEKSGGSWLLIILLIILIILVVLAIIFRNQLKVWWFRFKSKLKFGKHKPTGGRPPGPPSQIPQLRPRQIIPRQPYRRPPARRPPMRRSAPKKDSVFEDTMKKLRDMSK
tara:strand:- start:1600 stop:3438 length:1839 start_codon:yes stop_codon:yes gene_type:complete